VEKYVDNHKLVNIDSDGESAYPSWSELEDLSTAFPARPAEGEKYSMGSKEGEETK
jgi:hypothetical protein